MKEPHANTPTLLNTDTDVSWFIIEDRMTTGSFRSRDTGIPYEIKFMEK